MEAFPTSRKLYLSKIFPNKYKIISHKWNVSIWTRFSDLYSCSIKFWLMTFMHDFGWFVHGVRMIHQFDSEAVRPLLILNMWVCLLNSRIKWFLQIRKLGICLQQLQVLHLSDSVIWNLNFVIYINLKVNLWRSCKTETASFYSLFKNWSQVS